MPKTSVQHFFWLFQECRFYSRCKLLQWVRAESGYEVSSCIFEAIFHKWCYQISQRVDCHAWLNRQKSRWEDYSVSEASHTKSRWLVVLTHDPSVQVSLQQVSNWRITGTNHPLVNCAFVNSPLWPNTGNEECSIRMDLVRIGQTTVSEYMQRDYGCRTSGNMLLRPKERWSYAHQGSIQYKYNINQA